MKGASHADKGNTESGGLAIQAFSARCGKKVQTLEGRFGLPVGVLLANVTT